MVVPQNYPWLLMGDFNAIIGAHENLEGRTPSPTACSDYASMISDNELRDIETKGARFTWARFSTRGDMECRLVRSICKYLWLEFWSSINCYTLPRHSSDHYLLVLNCSQNYQFIHPPFRFQSMWTEHDDFTSFISKKWHSYPALGNVMFAFLAKLRFSKKGLKSLE